MIIRVKPWKSTDKRFGHNDIITFGIAWGPPLAPTDVMSTTAAPADDMSTTAAPADDMSITVAALGVVLVYKPRSMCLKRSRDKVIDEVIATVSEEANVPSETIWELSERSDPDVWTARARGTTHTEVKMEAEIYFGKM